MAQFFVLQTMKINKRFMKLMQKNIKILLLAIFVSAASCSFTTKEFNDPNKDKLLLDLITYVLEKAHFDPKDINDAFSEHLFNTYIEKLDPLKRYFLNSDIEEFSTYKTQLDDQIKTKDLTFFNLVYDRLVKRIEEAKKIYPKALEKPFDFLKQENINADFEKIPYAASKKELEKRWRKQLKFSTISTLYDLIEENGTPKKTDSITKTEKIEPPKSLSQLEIEARESIKKSMDEYFDLVDDMERKDYFAMFLNTLTEEFDPHTNYFAPPDRDKFDMQMSGKLEGIGARLQKKNDYIKVIEVISGGPVWRGEYLDVGDLLLKVKQEDEEAPVSIVGMRIDDAVKLIKGPKGTKVTLTVKRVNGTIEDVTITRDVVELEETYAKSTLIKKGEKTFGLIYLPQFYFDMNNYKNRNAASDIKKELIRLKKQGVEGIIIDIRDNGGGSLRTAVDLGGLFIKNGPMVQVQMADDEIEILKDTDNDIVWNGPLVVLVNGLSASASEIFAAAMQDYKRAIIIGSKQTYGKGTVQNLIDLNRWMRKNDMGDLGALKLTTQKFYRVNGGSTQLEGVKSDVEMPDRYSYIDVGEKDYDNPLPYDKISPANYNTWDGYEDFETVIEKSKKRIKANEFIKLLDEEARWVKQKRDENIVNLNIDAYKAEVEKRREEIKRFDAVDNYDNKLSYESLPYEINLMKLDTTLKEKRKRWHKNLTKDIYVDEAVRVLEDLTLATITKHKVAKIKD